MKTLEKMSVRNWAAIAVINFLMVGLLGLLMRLKIILPISWVNQQYVLNAHWHFAFSGWVTHTLMFAVGAILLNRQVNQTLPYRQQVLLLANLLLSYGMLIAFSMQGYGIFSITLTTLSILVSYIFAAMHWQGTNSHPWLRASLLFLVISSLGTFYMSYLMATNNIDSRKQLMASYFYLHFQYNGWFFFACMGLFQEFLKKHRLVIRRQKLFFWVFFASCFPGYFLSVLWFDMPSWLYFLVVAAAGSQLLVWVLWLRHLWKPLLPLLRQEITQLSRVLLFIVGSAITLKFLLQVFSVIPELSRFAYGYRPIVIAYLHLVLLVIISLFLLYYLFTIRVFRENKVIRISTAMLVIGIILTEFILMLQGLSGVIGVFFSSAPFLLAYAAGVICLGLSGLILGLINSKAKLNV